MKYLKLYSIIIGLIISTLGYAQSKETAKLILKSYFELKEALAKTDGAEAAKYAKVLVDLAAKSENNIIDLILSNAKVIASSEDTKTQRASFSLLSDNVYELIKSTGANDATVYRQFCPMAFNNSGAYWLSISNEIKNPYFGDMMLNCGVVKETIE